MSGSVNIQYCSYTDVEKQERHCCTILQIPLNFMFYLRVPKTPVKMNSYKFYPCSIFITCKILKNSWLGTIHTKGPRIRHRRIYKGSNFLFSHLITVSGVSKEATTAWKEIFLYAKNVYREVKICDPNQPLLQISRIISEYFSKQT